MTIRNRILIFSILVTLIPSVGMGWFLNNTIHSTITEKIEQQLLDSSSIIKREISLWFKERSYDLNVFSNSFVITENFTRYINAGKKPGKQATVSSSASKTMATYLSSVQKQFEDYTRLFVLEVDGTVVASSATEEMAEPIPLPEDIAEQIEATKYFRGEIHFAKENNDPLMLIGTPLFSDHYDNYIGLLAIEIRLEAILPLVKTGLAKSENDASVSASLLTLKDGRHFLSNNSAAYPATCSENRGLFNEPPQLENFSNHQTQRVVGVASTLEELHWGLIISMDHDTVFMKVTRSRNRNILIAVSFALVIGFAAYFFAKQIIRPLATLTNGALQVADGNLDTRLPILHNDELGFTTRVFNGMVAELQQSHNQLEQLATTDSLTGLANRQQIMERLATQFEHHQRYRTEFSILMIDIDFFKKTNDSHGHQAGDTVLSELGRVFLQAIRNVDTAGRYGGEEFLIILAETDGEKAQHTAERIRHTVREHRFTSGGKRLQITVSIGVATVMKDDENEGSLISRADKALYQAKANGRNQVKYMDDDSTSTSHQSKIISLPRTS